MKDFFHDFTTYEELSTRSKNIVNDLGGLQAMLNHFKKYGNFNDVRNSGRKTNRELSSLSNYLLTTGTEQLSASNELFVIEKSELTEFYIALKSKLSVRANNILTRMEKEYSVFNQEDGLFLFLSKIIEGEIDFTKERNCGLKTILELSKIFKDDLKPFLLITAKDDLSPEEILLKSLTSNIRDIHRDRVHLLIDGVKYNFIAAVILYLEKNSWNEGRGNAFRLYYFSEDFKTLQMVADEIGCTRERVRQLVLKYEKNIENAVSVIKQKINGKIDFWPMNQLENDIAILDLSTQIFPSDFELKNAQRLSREIIKAICKNSHVILNDILDRKKVKFKAINFPEELIIFKNDFNSKIDIQNFISWVDIEIFNLERIQIEYDMLILVERYFNNHGVNVEKGMLHVLSELFIKIKKDFTGTAVLRKGEREQIKSRIIELVKERIVESEAPVKTDALLTYLEERGIDTNKHDLLRLLNSEKDSFSMFGSGTWALADWRSQGLIGGSLRDITINLLSESYDPLHVSKILEYVRKYRPITLHSFMSNLRAVDSDIFIFFNCHYLGLKTKQYTDQWYNLPRMLGTHFRKSELDKAAALYGDKVEEYYLQKYGYPMEHTRFIISEKDF